MKTQLKVVFLGLPIIYSPTVYFVEGIMTIERDGVNEALVHMLHE
jgi:hypothetical protein